MGWREKAGRFGVCLSLALAAVVGGYGSSADAALIASDSFLTGSTATNGEYETDPVTIVKASGAGQNPTVFGFTGAWTGNVLTPPPNPVPAQVLQWGVPTGSIAGVPYAEGGRARYTSGSDSAQRRVQRTLASYTPSNTYWFSLVTQIQAGDSDGSGFLGVGFTAGGLSDGAIAGSVDAFRGLLIGAAANDGGTPGAGNTSDDKLDLVIRHRGQTAAGPPATFGALNTVIKSNVGSGTINRVIVKLEVNAVGGNQERITAWVNPANVSSEVDLGVFSAQFLSFTMATNAEIMAMTMVGLNYSQAGSFDEPKMGTALADVVPEPASTSLLLIAGVAFLRRRSFRPSRES